MQQNSNSILQQHRFRRHFRLEYLPMSAKSSTFVSARTAHRSDAKPGLKAIPSKAE